VAGFWLVCLLMFDYGFSEPSPSVLTILSYVIKGSRRQTGGANQQNLDSLNRVGPHF